MNDFVCAKNIDILFWGEENCEGIVSERTNTYPMTNRVQYKDNVPDRIVIFF